MTALAIQTDSLTKRFRSGQVAVDAIDLQVPLGSVYGFLGPNGSGKTTTIRMLLALISPTSGSARVLGETVPGRSSALLPRVGALVEGPAFYPHLSGRANLSRLDAADAAADPRTSTTRVGLALERVGLTAAASKRYRQYSLGMRQRLGIAAALLRQRELLLLDEPTNGLDPQGTREMRHLVASLAHEGTTVLVSSHLLAEVEQMCTHVGIMHRGRLVVQGSLDQIERQARAEVRVTVDPATAGRGLEILTSMGLAGIQQNGAVITAELGALTVPDVASALVNGGVRLEAIGPGARRLEDVFVALTGEGFDVAR